jgi:hypothetical protein
MDSLQKIFSKLHRLDESILVELENMLGNNLSDWREIELRGDIVIAILQHLSVKFNGFPEIFVNYILSKNSSKERYKLLRCFNILTNPNNKKTIEVKNEFEIKEEHFTYIPYSPEAFLNLIESTNKFNKKRFLDVGHGTGSKVILAYLFGDFYTAGGVEYNELTCRLSKDFVHNWTSYKSKSIKDYKEFPHNLLFKCDALEFDRYNEFDYIYMYEPMREPAQMIKLYDKIFSDCEIGTLIVNVLHFNSATENIYLKSKFKFNKSKHYPFKNKLLLIKTKENEFDTVYINY